jgi:hypothetical protein
MGGSTGSNFEPGEVLIRRSTFFIGAGQSEEVLANSVDRSVENQAAGFSITAGME